ncbi:MAG TPA: hypothetical protein VLX68_15200 [Chitinivibrionales bacterium]|nr:hypothetical protein [Chitinivibrionales bacterium]
MKKVIVFALASMLLTATSALSADVAIFPTTVKNLSSWSGHVVDRALAKQYAMLSHRKVSGALKIRSALKASNGDFLSAARKLGVKEYIITSAVGTQDTVVIESARFDQTGTEIRRAQMRVASRKQIRDAGSCIMRALVDPVTTEKSVRLDDANFLQNTAISKETKHMVDSIMVVKRMTKSESREGRGSQEKSTLAGGSGTIVVFPVNILNITKREGNKIGQFLTRQYVRNTGMKVPSLKQLRVSLKAAGGSYATAAAKLDASEYIVTSATAFDDTILIESVRYETPENEIRRVRMKVASRNQIEEVCGCISRALTDATSTEKFMDLDDISFLQDTTMSRGMKFLADSMRIANQIAREKSERRKNAVTISLACGFGTIVAVPVCLFVLVIVTFFTSRPAFGG